MQWRTAAQTWEQALAASPDQFAGATGSPHTITGLANDNEYTVRVRAVNAAEPSRWSGEMSATPEVPPMLTEAKVDIDDVTSIQVTVNGGPRHHLGPGGVGIHRGRRWPGVDRGQRGVRNHRRRRCGTQTS